MIRKLSLLLIICISANFSANAQSINKDTLYKIMDDSVWKLSEDFRGVDGFNLSKRFKEVINYADKKADTAAGNVNLQKATDKGNATTKPIYVGDTNTKTIYFMGSNDVWVNNYTPVLRGGISEYLNSMPAIVAGNLGVLAVKYGAIITNTTVRDINTGSWLRPSNLALSPVFDSNKVPVFIVCAGFSEMRNSANVNIDTASFRVALNDYFDTIKLVKATTPIKILVSNFAKSYKNAQLLSGGQGGYSNGLSRSECFGNVAMDVARKRGYMTCDIQSVIGTNLSYFLEDSTAFNQAGYRRWAQAIVDTLIANNIFPRPKELVTSSAKIGNDLNVGGNLKAGQNLEVIGAVTATKQIISGTYTPGIGEQTLSNQARFYAIGDSNANVGSNTVGFGIYNPKKYGDYAVVLQNVSGNTNVVLKQAFNCDGADARYSTIQVSMEAGYQTGVGTQVFQEWGLQTKSPNRPWIRPYYIYWDTSYGITAVGLHDFYGSGWEFYDRYTLARVGFIQANNGHVRFPYYSSTTDKPYSSGGYKYLVWNLGSGIFESRATIPVTDVPDALAKTPAAGQTTTENLTSSKIIRGVTGVQCGLCTWYTGNGAPNGVVTGIVCDMYTRMDGGTGTTFYIKETGAGTNTGWIAK